MSNKTNTQSADGLPLAPALLAGGSRLSDISDDEVYLLSIGLELLHGITISRPDLSNGMVAVLYSDGSILGMSRSFTVDDVWNIASAVDRSESEINSKAPTE